MKLLQDNIVPNQPGYVTILPQELEDLWFLHNLIVPGDVIISQTTRKVTNSVKGKGPVRVRIKLEIKISDITFEEDSEVMRLRGKIIAENPHAAAGSFHTLEIEKNKQFDLRKTCWDSDSVDALRESGNKTSDADLAVILMQETVAYVYLVGKKIIPCERIEDVSSKTSSANMFFESVFRAFVKHIDFGDVRCVVIGSPGSIKDDFRVYLSVQAKKSKVKAIEDNKSRIVLVSTSNDIDGVLGEILNDDAVINLIKDTKAAMEIRVFQEFSKMLEKNRDRACYGLHSVEYAHELKAVETLLITDELVKSRDFKTRNKYSELLKSVKNVGGKAFVYSTRHVFGEQLATLTGIAAILRFPLPDLDEMVL